MRIRYFLKRHRAQSAVRTFLALLCCVLSLAVPMPAMAGDDALTVAQAAALRGKVHRLTQSVTAGEVTAHIPITVIAGDQDGPTLLALAGVHGAEYSPIVATQRLGQLIVPEGLSGTLILIHMANQGAYIQHRLGVHPADGKNINRVFPGKRDGTISEAIAYYLTSTLYPLADAVLDLHSGDGNEMLKPSWTGFYETAPRQDVVERSRALAHAFGIQHIVPFQWDVSDPSKAIWGGSAAIAMGVPSLDVEAGGRGLYDPQAITQIEEGVQRVMVYLGMLKRDFAPLPKPIMIGKRESVSSPVTGSWVPLIAAGEHVKAGDLVGYVTDYHGVRQFEVRAPMDGLVLIRLEAPPVSAGMTVATIAQVD